LRHVLLTCLLLSVACNTGRLHVELIATPEYPIPARGDIEGTVEVDILIGPDGKVFAAKGSGAHPLLIEAAERNVRQWVFGPFPPVAEFPISHKVTYVYRLEGAPSSMILPPTIYTHLPDRIELVCRPFRSDYPETIPQGELPDNMK
jgi:hypothetical protein